MAWLFERTIEAAAWVAMLVAWLCLGTAIYRCSLWIGTIQTEPDFSLLRDAAMSSAAFLAAAVALGLLACVDRFLFDADEHAA
ncbi:hypothetical protein Mal64_12100 [Pseudobythopirellula maris]|uniref:Uncharacterized protein n=1 Tax=Pseudobythopirellula maris TaxID=2527991 RepID=A0A5C5ZWX9_9BACT|nr:hypothetical protein [Pseudobythopirellula maris]TWT90813.1 hypothetical protein Mal64_12100 [Pseudobythopirellula maris]